MEQAVSAGDAYLLPLDGKIGFLSVRGYTLGRDSKCQNVASAFLLRSGRPTALPHSLSPLTTAVTFSGSLTGDTMGHAHG